MAQGYYRLVTNGSCRMLLTGTSEELETLSFLGCSLLPAALPPPIPAGYLEGTAALYAEAERQIHAYFNNTLQSFSLPLAPHGTPFQKKVWQIIQNIPYGQVISYKQEAFHLDPARQAWRAVGSANGRNPLPLLIPCHRIIRSDGRIGGYSGGTGMKRRLLELEGWSISSDGRISRS